MRSLQGTRRLVWPRTRIGKGTLPTPRVTHSNVAERTGGGRAVITPPLLALEFDIPASPGGRGTQHCTEAGARS